MDYFVYKELLPKSLNTNRYLHWLMRFIYESGLNQLIMKHSIIVVAEGQYLFGFDLAAFDGYFPLNEIWISPLMRSEKVWKFSKKDHSLEGLLVSFNQMMFPDKVSFHYNGTVFIKKASNTVENTFGFFCNQIIAQVALEEKDKRMLSVEDAKKYPPIIKTQSYSSVFKYKRKYVFIVDPEAFFINHLA